MSNDIEGMNVDELKKALKARVLKVSGKKEDLKQRLSEAVGTRSEVT